ncbi:MAG: hypothetical protein GXY23_02550 [Myxococcales bacterium]|nr:hypothetical protein [Myxococcales bacterium]
MRPILLVVVLAFAAGCGGGTPAEPPPPPAEEPTHEPAPPTEGPAPSSEEPLAAADSSSPAPSTRGPFGQDDDRVLAALREQPPAEVMKGRGGRSLSFKITLEDGTTGYFKPEQSFSGAHFDSEIAAYCVDRALGFGRVAPVTGRTLPFSALARAAGDDARRGELAIQPDGMLRGAFVAWIEGSLPRFDPGRGFERALRLEPPPRVNPYQAPIDVRRSANREERPDAEIHDPKRPEAALTEARIAELSDLVIFDYLVQNVDRWGGGFTNLRLLGEDGPLIFLDNGAGFWRGEQRLPLLERRLASLQRFRRETVEALRAFDAEAFERCLDADPLAPVLDEKRREGLRLRVRAVLDAIDALEARFGDAIYIESAGML